jgi:hypothetical protein
MATPMKVACLLGACVRRWERRPYGWRDPSLLLSWSGCTQPSRRHREDRT